MKLLKIDELKLKLSQLEGEMSASDFWNNQENAQAVSQDYQDIKKEIEAKVNDINSYIGFQEKANEVKFKFLSYIINERLKGKKIIAFGAAAKGNTFLNYCGVKSDIIECVVDDTPSKQGKYLPQSHIPVVSRDYFKNNKPDIIIILPWNFKKEISEKLSFTKSWGAQLVTYIPEIEIH